MAARVEMIACPLCGTSRTPRKDGTRFTMDLGQAWIVDIREAGPKQGGTGVKGRGKAPGYGFPRVDGLTLEEMAASGRYESLIEEIRRGAQEILRRLGDYG